MMKFKFLLILMVTGLFFSCSSDSKDDNSNEDTIVGIWQAHELKVNNDTASDDEKNARDLLNFLTLKDCYVLSFEFKADLTVIIENSVQYIEIGLNSEGNGFDIPCPTEKDTETTVYVYENGQLTYTDEDQQTITVDVTIDGDIMTVDASDLDIPNLNAGGQLIFKRK
ncbi:hypothetical protein MWU78_10310 [Arenibacter sp. F26102]|uniref:hypothetical protein n=1 Tax=Arenibacter sp. F26102 TaxID=2926416 RepID=UPI001FF3D8BB|nr:hypothetical protein [Arenibacter sp. F26102]MCK0146038.1 hypothetical protein [Arenibacter sp. F26102]